MLKNETFSYLGKYQSFNKNLIDIYIYIINILNQEIRLKLPYIHSSTSLKNHQ